MSAVGGQSQYVRVDLLSLYLFPEVLTLRRCFPLPFALKPSELIFSGKDSFVIKFRTCVPFVHFVC